MEEFLIGVVTGLFPGIGMGFALHRRLAHLLRSRRGTFDAGDGVERYQEFKQRLKNG